MEIVQGVHQIKVPLPAGAALDHINAYLIEGTKGNLLIDTGFDTPEAFAALRDGLRFSGFGFKDITQIVITHIHPDHYGMADKIETDVRGYSSIQRNRGKNLLIRDM